VELHESLQAELNLAPGPEVGRMRVSVPRVDRLKRLDSFEALLSECNDPAKWRSAEPGGDHKKRRVMQVNPLAAEEKSASVRRRSRRYYRRHRRERLEDTLRTIKVNGNCAGRVLKGQRVPHTQAAKIRWTKEEDDMLIRLKRQKVIVATIHKDHMPRRAVTAIMHVGRHCSDGRS